MERPERQVVIQKNGSEGSQFGGSSLWPASMVLLCCGDVSSRIDVSVEAGEPCGKGVWTSEVLAA